MTRQAHHPDIVAEVLATELGADAEVLRELENLGLPFEVPKRGARLVSGSGEIVKVLGGGELDGLKGHLSREATDDDAQVVRGARGGAEGLDLLLEELQEGFGVQQGLGLLEEEGLVRRATSLGNEHEVVLVALGCEEVNLRRQIGLRVRLAEHVRRHDLGIPQVGPRVRVVDALREVGLVLTVREDMLPALAHDDGRARVLAHGQDHRRRNVGVLEHLDGHELVVLRGLRVFQNVGQRLEMSWPQEVGDIYKGRRRQEPESLRRHAQELLPIEGHRLHIVPRQLPVLRLVAPRGSRSQTGWKQGLVREIRGRRKAPHAVAAHRSPPQPRRQRPGQDRRTHPLVAEENKWFRCGLLSSAALERTERRSGGGGGAIS
mmetsp:Transcript_8147/g.23142  ORF Transcript_8147/g.23142 Transcript_8147/m.23142 type:complete len:376 (-) Transcript_8147:14-1141(-)